MSALVTDTHALIWYVNGSARLSSAARDSFRQAEVSGALIYIPSIVVVELRYLIEKRTLTEADYDMILAKISSPLTALTVAPLDLIVADALSQIPRQVVPDMPDRIIAATALALSLPLVTRDSEISKLTSISVVW